MPDHRGDKNCSIDEFSDNSGSMTSPTPHRLSRRALIIGAPAGPGGLSDQKPVQRIVRPIGRIIDIVIYRQRLQL